MPFFDSTGVLTVLPIVYCLRVHKAVFISWSFVIATFNLFAQDFNFVLLLYLFIHDIIMVA